MTFRRRRGHRAPPFPPRAWSLLLPVLLACCSNDLEDPMSVFPPPGTSFSLNADVQPILSSRCALSGCHADPLGAPMSLAAGDTFGTTVGVPSLELPGMDRVEPGMPDLSYLVHKVQGTHLIVAGGGDRMPPPYAPDPNPLSSIEIDIIRGWVEQGAPDN